ncbi:hypothetical protein KEHDKFFH_02420 [Marinobacter maroccanus]|uniref:Uncharacterized protein n=1 Tax=Marinobacter maroccanus TaxID=2055143 RepID=A0A2S5ZG57_9GAMM|nr:hypothetical protein [Marinobacter maroccanus]PPI86194.1 hypothetical protein KEHDKFFH_02420 [Marinobacter maroccanus]
MTFKVKLLVIAVVLAGVGLGGWTARGWFEDAKRLAIVEDRQELAEQIRGDISGIAQTVEARLGELRANERIIDRGIIREIQKPIYQRVCAEPDVVRLLNAALRGESVPGPAEPSVEVPGGTSPAGER